jgi:hypothetical protein
MADTVSVLTSASHPNVATEMRGFTPHLAGWHSGAVPLALQVKGDAVDVSDYSTLRVILDVTSCSNRAGAGKEQGVLDAAVLRVTLETRPVGGKWRPLRAFEPHHAANGPGSQRIVISDHDEEIRASYFFARSNVPGTITDEVAFTFAITAAALPEAA